MNETVAEAPDFDAAIRAAQDRLAHVAEVAKLTGDPARPVIEALALHLGALVHVRRADIDLVNRRLDVLDDRLNEIHDLNAEIKEAGAAAVAGAKAEIAGTQADLARQAASRIADAAAHQLRTMTRTSWLRAVSAAVGIGLIAFVTGGVLGFAWGGGSAAHTIRTADAIVHFVAAKEGLSAVRDWDTLMRFNPIEVVMARCTGTNLAVEGDRKACRMWLWIEPLPPSQPKKSRKG